MENFVMKRKSGLQKKQALQRAKVVSLMNALTYATREGDMGWDEYSTDERRVLLEETVTLLNMNHYAHVNDEEHFLKAEEIDSLCGYMRVLSETVVNDYKYARI